MHLADFYAERLTLHARYALSVHAIPGNKTHDLGIASTMLYSQRALQFELQEYLFYKNT